MLSITREENQRVMIGDNVIIKIVKITRGKVKLAISAPKEISVDREEAYKSKQIEKAKKAEANRIEKESKNDGK